MTLYLSPSPSSSIPVTLDCRHIVVNVNRVMPGKPRSSLHNMPSPPPPMATYFHLPTYLPTQEEVIRAKRLINSRAFRRLFPSTLCPPISQFVRNIDSITRYCSLQIPVCYTSPPPLFFSFSTLFLSTLPSFLSPRQPREWIPPPSTYSVSSFESELGRGSCAPERERGRERERDNYRVSQGKICKFVPIRGLVTIVIFHRAYLDRFLTRAFPTFTVTSDREITLT